MLDLESGVHGFENPGRSDECGSRPRLSGHGGNRAGFTILELIITIALIGILAGILAPEVMGRLGIGQTSALVGTLSTVRDAVTNHREDVGRYPRLLRQLVVAPAAGAQDVCARSIPVSAYSSWAGPYINRDVPPTGIPLAMGTVSDTVKRNPAGYTESGTIFIEVKNVEQAIATRVDDEFDGVADFASGTILWTEIGSTGVGTLTLAIPARGC